MINTNNFSSNSRELCNVTPNDIDAIQSFLRGQNLIYQHLDWLSPSDWVGYQPFLMETMAGEIQAVLLTATDTPSISWVRLFAIKRGLSISETWDRLFQQSILILKTMGVNQIAALGISDWLNPTLKISGFKQYTEIINLECFCNFLHVPFEPCPFYIRPMQMEDLEAVWSVDQNAFQELWQNSLAGLKKAFNEQGIKTVAFYKDNIIGYQISTTAAGYAHIARLAVHPNYQGKRVSTALMVDLFNRIQRSGTWRVTVNTQVDNLSSLAVYQKFGFKKSSQKMPVYLLNI